MVRAAWLTMMLVGACATEVGQTDDNESFSCRPSDDEVLGCCAAGSSCTWAAPVGASCTDEFVPLCAHGLGWCGDSVCREFCSAVDLPRCGAGLAEHHETLGELGDADLCVCVPE